METGARFAVAGVAAVQIGRCYGIVPISYKQCIAMVLTGTAATAEIVLGLGVRLTDFTKSEISK